MWGIVVYSSITSGSDVSESPIHQVLGPYFIINSILCSLPGGICIGKYVLKFSNSPRCFIEIYIKDIHHLHKYILILFYRWRKTGQIIELYTIFLSQFSYNFINQFFSCFWFFIFIYYWYLLSSSIKII